MEAFRTILLHEALDSPPVMLSSPLSPTHSPTMPALTGPFNWARPERKSDKDNLADKRSRKGSVSTNSSAPSEVSIPSMSHSAQRSVSVSPPATPDSRAGAAMAKLPKSRLRSKSGLSLHTNNDLLRKYTDYLPDGTAPKLSHHKSNSNPSNLRKTKTPPRDPSMTVVESSYFGDRPVDDLCGREVFDEVMGNPEAASRLLAFATSRGRGQDIEFLRKTREYTRALEEVVAQVSAISSSFTSVTATTPIDLPNPTSRNLHHNLKNMITSVIPGLDTIFLESREFVERRVAADIFPQFVKHQLSIYASVTLALEADGVPVAPRFAGLGESFCLTDPSRDDNSFVCASDGFEEMTGFPRYEIMGQTCAVLQGPYTGRDAMARMRRGVGSKQEMIELVLNYRNDGQPFWNLVYLCPLLDAAGRLKHYLAAQLDISASVNEDDDILKLLTYSPHGSRGSRGSVPQEEAISPRTAAPERKMSTPQVEEVPLKSAKKGFFKPFRRQNSSTSPLNAQSANASFSKPSFSKPSESEETSATTMFLRELAFKENMVPTPYSRFMVLQHVPSYPSAYTPSGVTPDLSGLNKKMTPGLNVAYCSQGVIDVLNLGMAADVILQKDVFDVLAEQANSPSVTKAFKATVRDAVITNGRSISTELTVTRVGTGNGSSLSPSTSGSVGGSTGGFRERMMSRSESLGTEGARGVAVGGGTPLGKMVTYWTPLKDAEDEVIYVMLVLSPMAIRE